MSWLDALILGIVQGLTEFLPISSDGHLSITQKFLAWMSGRTQTGEENLFFVVMVHLGTLAAILVYYRKVGLEAVRGVLGSDRRPTRISIARTSSARAFSRSSPRFPPSSSACCSRRRSRRPSRA